MGNNPFLSTILLPITFVENEVMRKLSMEELNRKSVEDFKKSDKMPILVVLENIRSAYNVGSVFRSADAFLVEGILLCGYTAFPPHKEIKKTALGADDSVNWKHFKKTDEALAYLKENNYLIYAIEQAEKSKGLHQFNWNGSKLAIVFGNEVTGVEQETLLQCHGCIEIPQLGMKHSLNVSVAAGVVLWELVRGRMG